MNGKLIERFTGVDGKRNVIEALSSQSIFRNNTDVIEAFASSGTVMTFDPEEVLIYEGGVDRHIFFILAGETIINVHGQNVARRSAGTHIGEMAMVDTAAVRSAKVTAAVETVVFKVEENIFNEIADSHGYLWKGIAKELASRLRQRNTTISPGKRLVVLVHGIRTHAEWQETVVKELQNEHTKVIPIKYDFLDIFSFWCPIITRHKPITEIHWKLSQAIFQNPGYEVIVIAHSFGTYAMSQIIKHNPLLRVSRIILCGGIIPKHFKWGELANRPTIILNDCGCNDIMPILAKAASWGFGPSGTFGFGTPEVTDRYSENKHSGFFDTTYVREHWKPFVESGFISKIDHERPEGQYLKKILAFLPLQWLIVLVFIIMIIWLYISI
jgi:hypothetical protein